MKDYQLDGNKEMVALGTMNIVGSMTSCYVATGKLVDKVYVSIYYCHKNCMSKKYVKVVMFHKYLLLALKYQTKMEKTKY